MKTNVVCLSNRLLHNQQSIDYKNIQLTHFIPEEYIVILSEQLFPKILSVINNVQKQLNWQNFFNSLISKTHLNYSNEETYLLAHNLCVPDVIQNSIFHVFPDFKRADSFELVSQFIPLLAKHKIKIFQDSEVAIYSEIILLIEYIRSIQNLIQRYKKPYSDNKGTGQRSSSLKALVKTQINMLENRLNGAHFRIQNNDEIEQTIHMIKILKISQTGEYKNIIEFMNFGKLVFGLDMKFLNLTSNEQNALEQVLDFHNGVRSNPHELVRSVMIYMDVLFDKSELNPTKKADCILNITRFFFPDELRKEEKCKKNKLAFNHRHIKKPYKVKTILHQVPVFTYLNTNSNDFLGELLEIGLHGILGIKNIYAPESPTFEDISWFTIGRNLLAMSKEFGFTQKELRVLLFFLPKDQPIEEEKILLLSSSKL